MYFKFVVPSLSIAAMVASAQTSTPAPTVHVVEEIVAKVNGEIITRGELEEENKRLEASAAQMGIKNASRDEKVKAAETNVLREKIDLTQSPLRRFQHRLTFACQPSIGARSLDDRDTELFFERTQRVGQRRLSDVAGLGGPAEMTMFV